jgi:peptidoglycan/LPS O-acetylase OafA/YrhL
MLFGFSVYAIYVHNAFNSILSNRLLVLFGRYSFFIYLFHGFLLHALLSFRVEMNVFGVFGLLVYTLIVLLVSLVLGYASWTLFESKFLKIKEMRVK